METCTYPDAEGNPCGKLTAWIITDPPRLSRGEWVRDVHHPRCHKHASPQRRAIAASQDYDVTYVGP